MKCLHLPLRYVEACPICGVHGRLYMQYLIHGERVYGPYYRVQHGYTLYDPAKYLIWQGEGKRWKDRRSARLTQHIPKETWCYIGRLHD